MAKDIKKKTPKKVQKKKKTKKPYQQIIFRDWCKACGICSSFCPKGVIIRDENNELMMLF